MQGGGARMGGKRRAVFLPETPRWFASPVFPIVVLGSSAIVMANIIIAMGQVEITVWDLAAGSGGGILQIFAFTSHGFFRYVTLCLYSIPAAGLYAEDYEENAVYMRVQRLGGTRYGMGRVVHTLVSSWLCAFLAEMICAAILHICFGKQLLYVENGSDWLNYESGLLMRGGGFPYLLILVSVRGFEAAFYALAAMAFTVFVPNRRAAVALPMLFWYFNKYMITGQAWIPDCIQPAYVYDGDFTLMTECGILNSEWRLLGYVAGYTFLVAMAVFWLLLHALRRNGTFGGELE